MIVLEVLLEPDPKLEKALDVELVALSELWIDIELDWLVVTLR